MPDVEKMNSPPATYFKHVFISMKEHSFDFFFF